MFERQPYQFGSLSQKRRQKGPDVWEFRYYDALGNRKTVTVGSVQKYRSKAAAQVAVEGLVLRINAESPSLFFEPPKFRALVDRYMQEELPKRYSTRASYLCLLNKYIRPTWGDLALDRIKPMAVERWLSGLALASKTKTHIRGLMRFIFGCAERWELLEMGKNPIERVRVKGGSKREKRPTVLTHEEFSKLLENIPEPYRTMVLVAQCVGLRVSEIMGLQWGDLDFEKGTALVQRGVVHGRVDDVKTEYSHDRVPLDEQLVAVLKSHCERSLATGPEDWVFANPATDKPYHQEEIQKRYIRKAGEAVGIQGPIGWHTFRHTYRSWLDDTGAPIGVQRELMRHASIQTTMNIYGRAMSASKREANSKVVEMALNRKPDTAPANAVKMAVGA